MASRTTDRLKKNFAPTAPAENGDAPTEATTTPLPAELIRSAIAARGASPDYDAMFRRGRETAQKLDMRRFENETWMELLGLCRDMDEQIHRDSLEPVNVETIRKVMFRAASWGLQRGVGEGGEP